MAPERPVAVVTGAASGIGRATAVALAARNNFVVVADLDEEGAEQTLVEIRRGGGDGSAVLTDVSDEDSVKDLRGHVTGLGRSLASIVNVAGWDRTMPFIETERSFWEKVVAINYLGPVAVTHELLPAMIEAGDGGRIVNVASDAGRVGSLGETVYAGAKGGVIAFTKSLAREVAGYGIHVNCVCPGPTDTPLFHEQAGGIREALEKAIPFRRLGRAEEVASAIAFFASEESSYVTGQVLSVSGGLTMAG